MLKVRTTKTGSGSTAVQVVTRYWNRTQIVKHIGSAKDPEDVSSLLKLAHQYIRSTDLTRPLFEEFFQERKTHLVDVENLVFNKTYHSFSYEFLSYFYELTGFQKLSDQIIRDLVIMRILEPCSKRAALELLKEYFAITHSHTTMYQTIKKIGEQKQEIEKMAVAYAKNNLSFDFSLVFYDVTTLYFESFKEDADITSEKGVVIKKGMRKNGFSKDNKSNQPQIVIGLIVTREGFPVSYDVFEGNTFEGKTFIPTIVKFKDAHAVKTLTVVADAAMISFDNVQELLQADLSYIVGARMGNLKPNQIKEISTDLTGNAENIKEINLEKLTKRDGHSTRIETDRGLLVCDFSLIRYRKDKREMEKQVAKAQKLLDGNKALTRTKFIKNKDDKKTEQTLNTELIEKTKLLLGIKGYYTNLTTETNKTIINHYHSLWHVEKAFRIAKSDLEARPIFHHKRESIEAHILIVFISLCVTKAIELLTKHSIQKVKRDIWRILDIEFTDSLSGQTFTRRMDTSSSLMAKLWKTLPKIKT